MFSQKASAGPNSAAVFNWTGNIKSVTAVRPMSQRQEVELHLLKITAVALSGFSVCTVCDVVRPWVCVGSLEPGKQLTHCNTRHMMPHCVSAY